MEVLPEKILLEGLWLVYIGEAGEFLSELMVFLIVELHSGKQHCLIKPLLIKRLVPFDGGVEKGCFFQFLISLKSPMGLFFPLETDSSVLRAGLESPELWVLFQRKDQIVQRGLALVTFRPEEGSTSLLFLLSFVDSLQNVLF